MARPKSKTSVIYLVGMPGSGKTTLGKQLAQKLNYEFKDLDHVLEEEEKRTIPEIFKIDGEETFRKIEKRVVEESTSWENVVIATGGGAPCFFNNMEAMNKAGKTIFIDVNPSELLRRVSGKGQQGRPLFKDKSEEELLKEIQEKYNYRLQFYSLSDFILSSNNIKVKDLLIVLNNDQQA